MDGVSEELEQEETESRLARPDIDSLIERYRNDLRYTNNESERQACINILTELKEFVKNLKLPEGIETVILAGQFCDPNKMPEINGPSFQSAALIDLVLVRNPDISGKDYSFHNDAELIETVEEQAITGGFNEVLNKQFSYNDQDKYRFMTDISVQFSDGKSNRNDLIKNMMQNGVIIRGPIPPNYPDIGSKLK